MSMLIKILAVISCAELLVYYTHMFQLNSYMADRQMRWLKKNYVFGLLTRISFLIVAGVISIFSGDSLPLQIALAVCLLLQIILFFPRRAKKPLVFTKRVIRLIATEVIASAVISTAFGFAVESETALIAIGILAYFVVLLAGFINMPIEKHIQNQFINKAKKKLENMQGLIVIGITGSYGKTGVKNYLASILSAKYNVLMTPGSYNTTMGVVRTINEMLTPAHEIFICEMGAKARGQIKEICDIVHPHYAILTSVGPQHLENFGSMENIILGKFELCESLPDDGTAFVNFDNKYIEEHLNKSTLVCNTVKYGVEDKPESDYVGKNMTVTDCGTDFEIVSKSGERLCLSTKLAGRHNVCNITGCVALARHLKVTDAEIALAVKRLECVSHRLQIVPMGDGNTLIDDAFNANPDGVKAALEVLSGFDAKKIMITPGMIELGSVQYEENKRFGALSAQVCDKVYVVGECNAESILEGMSEKGYTNAVRVRTFNEGFAMAKADFTGQKKVILIENDLPDNYR